MTVTEQDLAALRTNLEGRMTAVSVEVMGAIAALSDHTSRFNRVENRLDKLDGRFDQVEARFIQVDNRFDHVDARFIQVDNRFNQVDARFAQADARFDRVDARFDRVDARIDDLASTLDRRFGWQTVMLVALGALSVFGDSLAVALGL